MPIWQIQRDAPAKKLASATLIPTLLLIQRRQRPIGRDGDLGFDSRKQLRARRTCRYMTAAAPRHNVSMVRGWKAHSSGVRVTLKVDEVVTWTRMATLGVLSSPPHSTGALPICVPNPRLLHLRFPIVDEGRMLEPQRSIL